MCKTTVCKTHDALFKGLLISSTLVLVLTGIGKDADSTYLDAAASAATIVGFPLAFIALYMSMRASQDAANYEAVTSTLIRLGEKEAFDLRGYVHQKFEEDFNQIIQAAFPKLWVNDKFSFAKALELGAKSEAERKDDLKMFHEALNQKCFDLEGSSGSKWSPRKAVELVLLQFDQIAILSEANQESADLVATIWKPVLRRSAPKILPFLVIERSLRGHGDYKVHYLQLLARLGILEYLAQSDPQLNLLIKDLHCKCPCPICSG